MTGMPAAGGIGEEFEGCGLGVHALAEDELRRGEVGKS